MYAIMPLLRQFAACRRINSIVKNAAFSKEFLINRSFFEKDLRQTAFLLGSIFQLSFKTCLQTAPAAKRPGICFCICRVFLNYTVIYFIFAAYVYFCPCFGIIYCTQSYVMIYAYIFMQSLIISVLIYSVFTPSALTLWLSGVVVFTYIEPYGR